MGIEEPQISNFIFWFIRLMRTLYYYFAVIARSIEGDESDAAIPGDLSRRSSKNEDGSRKGHCGALRPLWDRFAWVTARDDKWRDTVRDDKLGYGPHPGTHFQDESYFKTLLCNPVVQPARGCTVVE